MTPPADALWCRAFVAAPSVRAARARAMRRYRVLVVVMLLAGLVLRARGFLWSPLPLWFDEAIWIHKLLKTHLLEPNIRPIGFLAVSKLLVHWFGASERVLRLVPWLASLGTLFLSVPLAQRLFRRPAAQLFLIGVVALHPAAIDFGKEFKPYAISLLLHVACLYFALRYLDTRRLSAAFGAMAIGLCGPLFAQDIVFALPGLYLAVGWLAWRERNTRHLAAAAAGALVTIAGLLLLYHFFWRALDVGPGNDESMWADKYDVFFVRGRGEALWLWIARKYMDVAVFPGVRSHIWGDVKLLAPRTIEHLISLDRWFWLALHVLGVAWLVRRRCTTMLLLLVTPLLALLAFNLLGFWPFGAFRTNLFILAYVAPLSAFSVLWLPELVALETLPLALAVILPLLAFERDWGARKRWGRQSAFFEWAATLEELQGHPRREPEPLLADHAACTVFHYYLEIDPGHQRLARALRKRFKLTCEEGNRTFQAAARVSERRRAFVVLDNRREAAAAEREVAHTDVRVETRYVGTDLVLSLTPRRRASD